MLAPEPFFEPRGTPFSEFHRIKALVEDGHHVDLVTYPVGRDVDLPNLRMRIYKNGELHSEGLGSAVQGNPLTAVAWLANTLGEFGIPFKAGEVILSGSLAPLIPVVSGDEMRLEIDGIGGCSCRFV